MTERIIELAESPAQLSVSKSCLVVEQGGEPAMTAPLGEVVALILAEPRVLLTQPVLARLLGAGGVVIVCDGKRMPVGMMLPLEGHVTQSERFAAQSQASLPTKKRLWQTVVGAKIRAQARALTELREHDAGLSDLVPKVRSGDPANVEAEASRRYWPALLQDPAFRRARHGGRQNVLLNYGYAVLRAIVARGVCGAGLHPSLGIHHHNRYDAFPLVDDLMEPFRPVVDRTVASYCDAYGAKAPLDKRAKTALIGTLMGRFRTGREERSLFDIANRTAAALAAVFEGRRKRLLFPEI